MPAPTQPFNLSELDEVANADGWTNEETRTASDFVARLQALGVEIEEEANQCESSRDAGEYLRAEVSAGYDGEAVQLTPEQLDRVNWYEIAKNIYQGC